MKKPPAFPIAIAGIAIAAALALAGCAGLPGGTATPSVTIAPTYAPPTFTPIPTITPTPTPTATSWNGEMVELYGHVASKSGEHIYGTVTVSYLDEYYWEDHPSAKYDTDAGGNYSVNVRANLPFKVTLGYLYTSRLPPYMITRLYDTVYTIQEPTRLDFEVLPSNATIAK